MNGKQDNFRSWIEAGFKNYGKDPWFFIRELAQNSRDAGAHSIKVKIGYTTAKEEALIFEDDGCGMSYRHAKQFLFRLYASSKTGDKYSAGMFGIGFWTVLKFNPTRIIIESQWGKNKHPERWGVLVEVGSELKTLNTTCNLSGTGTRITLVRPAQEASQRDFYRKTSEALQRYCSYLRRNNRKGDVLPVLFDGKTISGEMTLPGPVALEFKDGPVEGAVGLASRPQVRLYVRGLPVWEGTSLDELSHTPPDHPLTEEFGQGLAPVFLLNGNRLEVNISRQKVIDDRHLRQVRKTAEQAMARMVENATDYVTPSYRLHRVIDKIKGSGTRFFNTFGKTFLLILLLLIPLEIFLLKYFYHARPAPVFSPAPANTLSLRADGPPYAGASVRQGSTTENPGFSYSPPDDHWFTLFYADHYNQAAGFLQTKRSETGLPDDTVRLSFLDGATQGVRVNLKIADAGMIFLPQPLFHGINPSTITINGQPVAPEVFAFLPSGEAVLKVAQNSMVRYDCCPIKRNNIPPLPQSQREQWLALPALFKLPEPLEQRLTQELAGDTEKKVAAALQLTATLCNYDSSATTAQHYAEQQKNSDWFRRVKEIGAGDCDILNGMTVLFLRKMGVPARLVIGAVGHKGKILPVLHAWTEYYDTNGQRRIVDASAYTSRLLNGRKIAAAPATNRAEPTRSTSQVGGNFKENRGIIYALGALLLILLATLVVLQVKARKKPPPVSTPILKQVEKSLAGMALHALVHPNQGTWGPAGGILDFRIIPTCNSRPLSLRRVLKMGQEQTLFTASAKNPLMEYWHSTPAFFPLPILDAGNDAFAPLLKLLPGAVHLDEIAALKVVDPKKAKASWLGQLVAAVNETGTIIRGSGIPFCLLAAGEMSGDFFDVDLSPLPRLPKEWMPNCFVAVNPSSGHLNALAAQFRTNPRLAQFRFIELVVKESRLVVVPYSEILEKVAVHLLLKHAGGMA